MSYGIRIWGGDERLQLDENSFTVRLVLSTPVTFSGSSKQVQTFAVPGGSTSQNSVATIVPIGSWNPYQTQFSAEVGGDGFVRVYNYVSGWGGTAVASGTMRLMVVRFK